jgi:hypothetical protein
LIKLWRGSSFWTQPWFLTLAVIGGQWYGVWWMSMGQPEPVYVPTTMVMASASDGINVTITAPGIPGMTALVQSTN